MGNSIIDVFTRFLYQLEIVKSMVLTWRVMRFPVVFGSCLGAYFLAFSYRKTYFHDEIEDARKKNLIHVDENREKLESAKMEVVLMKQQREPKS